ncbi:Acyltransferase LovD [Lachnellula suecica]|uniref:Acyltransferase LovD n=1 Tax=Lachnellula suecica TaxID=602035 RepID=A0A8T9C648_9HELO|nr:Acyltransferase LovD [Lachnellula suecica]
MANETFEQRMERACRDKEIPGAVLIADDKTGKFRYEKVFGNRSLKDPSKSDPMTIDSTMWLASCSKFPTSVAAMQCVERGSLKLDDDVTGILPELKGLKILKKFDDGDEEPTMVENTKPITLRHLLTHSSGLSYDVFNPVMARYRVTVDKVTPDLKIKQPMEISMKVPLLFEPGTSWEYSVGIDWAGKMVERVSGMELEAYLNKNVWGPLGTSNSITFHPKSHPTTFQKLTDMSLRQGGITPFGTTASPEAPVEYTEDRAWNLEAPDCFGGAGLFGALPDYQNLLNSICADDGKILKKETVDHMFQDHLSAASKAAMNEKLVIPAMRDVYGVEEGMEVTFGLGGMIYLKDVEGGRKAGTMNWGGYPNLIWFCDRKTGLSGISGTQICPPGDPKFKQLFALWEQELYKSVAKGKL